MNELNLAWSVYAGASVVLLLMWYFPVRAIKLVPVALLLYALVAALLLTPATVELEGGGTYWAPAFISLVMELLSGQQEQAMSRLWSLCAVTLLLWLLALLLRYLKARAQMHKAPGAGSESEKAG